MESQHAKLKTAKVITPNPESPKTASKKTIHTCIECLKTYTSLDGFKSHVKNRHAEIASKLLQDFCRICKLNFNIKSIYQQHYFKVHDTRTLEEKAEILKRAEEENKKPAKVINSPSEPREPVDKAMIECPDCNE